MPPLWISSTDWKFVYNFDDNFYYNRKGTLSWYFWGSVCSKTICREQMLATESLNT
jgi:hypothetical protein